MMRMTFDEYVKESDRFEQIHTKTFWPTPLQIEKFEENPDKWLMFACYLYECGKPPKTKAEMYHKKILKAFIDENLDIIDD